MTVILAGLEREMGNEWGGMIFCGISQPERSRGTLIRVIRMKHMMRLAALLPIGAGAWAQTQLPQAPSAVVRPLLLKGGVQVAREQPGAVSLTLDEAIQTGLKNNTALLISLQQERYVHGQILSVGNALLPSLTASAYTRAQEINLAALGFKPGAIEKK